uniref:Uncharacterized protein n=1 Tax=Rhizophora mucronata TaxID=61149 RepID=A0A2P2QDH2_RHIMU
MPINLQHQFFTSAKQIKDAYRCFLVPRKHNPPIIPFPNQNK